MSRFILCIALVVFVGFVGVALAGECPAPSVVVSSCSGPKEQAAESCQGRAKRITMAQRRVGRQEYRASRRAAIAAAASCQGQPQAAPAKVCGGCN